MANQIRLKIEPQKTIKNKDFNFNGGTFNSYHDIGQEQQDQNLRKHAQSTTGLRTASDKS